MKRGSRGDSVRIAFAFQKSETLVQRLLAQGYTIAGKRYLVWNISGQDFLVTSSNSYELYCVAVWYDYDHVLTWRWSHRDHLASFVLILNSSRWSHKAAL